MNRSSFSLTTTLVLTLAALLLAACAGSEGQESAATAEIKPTKTRIPLEEALPEAQPTEAAVEAGRAGGMRSFIIVPQESSASYLADEEFLEDALAKLGINAGDVDVVGTTENIEGQIQVDLQNLSSPLGKTFITADLSTLKTDQDRRDSWLQENDGGPQFARHPLASFSATGVDGLPDSYNEGDQVQFQLSGVLTVRETTIPVVFDVEAVVNGDTLSGTGETRLRLTDLGIKPPNFARTLSVADEFGIRVDLVAREQGG